MERAWIIPLLFGCALPACDPPCKPGYARHGRDCAKLPVVDAGQDANEAGQTDTADAGGRRGRDASQTQPDPDGSVPISPECRDDPDCADVERLRCVDSLCVEHDCYTGKPCAGSDVCEMHACVPFVPPERFPTGYVQTSGGGTVASAEHRLRWSAGMPQPFGVTTSKGYRLVLGPGAAR